MEIDEQERELPQEISSLMKNLLALRVRLAHAESQFEKYNQLRLEETNKRQAIPEAFNAGASWAYSMEVSRLEILLNRAKSR